MFVFETSIFLGRLSSLWLFSTTSGFACFQSRWHLWWPQSSSFPQFIRCCKSFQNDRNWFSKVFKLRRFLKNDIYPFKGDHLSHCVRRNNLCYFNYMVIILLIILLYILIINPQTYKCQELHFLPRFPLDYLSDSIYVMDILIHFRTGIMMKQFDNADDIQSTSFFSQFEFAIFLRQRQRHRYPFFTTPFIVTQLTIPDRLRNSNHDLEG